jgi:hypothetical protein
MVLAASQGAAADETVQQRESRAADNAVRRRLQDSVSLDVIETPFSEVVRQLGKDLDLPIILDPEGLEESDVTPDQLVTLKLQDKRADAVLRVLLEPLHLECGVRDGLLVITSREKYQSEFLSVRVFNVRALLDSADEPSKPLPRWQKPARPRGGFVGGTAGYGPAPTAPPAVASPVELTPAFSPETPSDHLVALVCDSIAPNSWTHRGGHATAKVFGGTLIVRQTEEAQEEITELIDQIRRASVVEDPFE